MPQSIQEHPKYLILAVGVCAFLQDHAAHILVVFGRLAGMQEGRYPVLSLVVHVCSVLQRDGDTLLVTLGWRDTVEQDA